MADTTMTTVTQDISATVDPTIAVPATTAPLAEEQPLVTPLDTKIISWFFANEALGLTAYVLPEVVTGLTGVAKPLGISCITIDCTTTDLQSAKKTALWLGIPAAAAFGYATWSFLRRKPDTKGKTMRTIMKEGAIHGLKHALVWIPAAGMLINSLDTLTTVINTATAEVLAARSKQ